MEAICGLQNTYFEDEEIQSGLEFLIVEDRADEQSCMDDAIDCPGDQTQSDVLAEQGSDLREFRFVLKCGPLSAERLVLRWDLARIEPETKLLAGISQAAAFEQTEDQFISFLASIVNVGLDPRDQFNKEQINEKLERLEADGLTSGNGASGYHLTNEGFSVVDRELQYAELENIQTAKEISQSRVEFMAKLNVLGGTIVDQDLIATYRRLARVHENQVAMKALNELELWSAIEIGQDGSRVSLTDEGRRLLAIIENYPDYFLRSASPPFVDGAIYRVLEEFCSWAGEVVDHETDISSLSFSTPEFQGFDEQKDLCAHLGTVLNLVPESIDRRLSDMKNKAYIAMNGDKLRVLHGGLRYLVITRRKERLKAGVLPEVEVAEVEDMIEQSQALAEALGDDEIISKISDRLDGRSLFEMKSPEFEAVKQETTQLLTSLRQAQTAELVEACIRLADGLEEEQLKTDLIKRYQEPDHQLTREDQRQLETQFIKLRREYAERAARRANASTPALV